MKTVTVVLLACLVGMSAACFCGPTCGCTGGYSGQSYPQAYPQAYPRAYQQAYPQQSYYQQPAYRQQAYQPQYSQFQPQTVAQNYAPAPSYGQGSYAIFYSDLTPFARKGAQTPQLYVQRLPQLQRTSYQNFNRPQIQPQQAPIQRPVAAPAAPYQETPVVAQPEAPIVTAPVPKTHLHFGEVATPAPVQGTFFTEEPEVVETQPPVLDYTTEAPEVQTTQVPVVYTTETVFYTTQASTEAPVTEQFDFDDDVTSAPAGKEEYYYVYYDNDGKRVGDSRQSTLPPQERALLIDKSPITIPESGATVTNTPIPTLITEAPEVTQTPVQIAEVTFTTEAPQVIEVVTETTLAPVAIEAVTVGKPATLVEESVVEESVSEAPVTLAPELHETLAPNLVETEQEIGTGEDGEEIVYEDIEYEDEKDPVDEKAKALGQRIETRVEPAKIFSEIYRKKKVLKTQRGIRDVPVMKRKIHIN